MIRLILFAAFIAIVALAILTMARAVGTIAGSDDPKDQDMIPSSLQRVTYLLLILLMLGVATGWLGAT